MTAVAIDPSPTDDVGPNPFGRGYTSMFAPEKLTVGLYFPIEAFDGPEPAMRDQVELAQEGPHPTSLLPAAK